MITNNFRKFIWEFDWQLFSAVFLLCLFGLAALYSVGLGRPDTNFIDFKKQIIFLIIGLPIVFIAGRLNFSFFRTFSKPLFFFSLFLLSGVLIFGRVFSGTRGWFVIGNFSFQPVELAKVALILILALYAASRARSFKTFNFFLGSIFLAGLPIILVIIQPDLGSSILLAAIWFTIILMASIKRHYLLFLLVGLLIGFFAGWFFLFKDYQRERVLTFLNSARDPYGRGYNAIQSVIAVGSGQFFGRGLGFGSQSQLRFLPENQTDFIFAVIAEEMGFVGVLLIIGLYGLLFFRLFKIALSCREDFSLFVILGIIGLFFTQFFINIGMNIGIVPVTGITLPFLSAGGSSLLVNLFLIGIAESVRWSS